MATIAATFIRHPRRERRCETCTDRIGAMCFRLYGSAERWEPKYTVYICDVCARWSCRHDRVLRKAVKAAGFVPFDEVSMTDRQPAASPDGRSVRGEKEE